MAKPEKKPAATRATKTGTSRGQSPASRANLAKGGGKKGRSGRKPRAFELLAQQLLDEDEVVQSVFEAALKDRFSKGYTGNLKLAAQLAGKLKAEAAPAAGPQFVIVVPAVPGSVEAWMQSYAPPDAVEQAQQIAARGGPDLSRIPEAEQGLAPADED